MIKIMLGPLLGKNGFGLFVSIIILVQTMGKLSLRKSMLYDYKYIYIYFYILIKNAYV